MMWRIQYTFGAGDYTAEAFYSCGHKAGEHYDRLCNSPATRVCMTWYENLNGSLVSAGSYVMDRSVEATL